MERNLDALDESHPFLYTIKPTIFPNYTLNKYPNDNLAFNHQNCEITPSAALKQISEVLLGENIDENFNEFPEEPALKAMERTFYDIIGENYPPSPNKISFCNLPEQNHSSADQYFSQNENLPIVEFKRGMKKGTKFLPSISKNGSLIHSPGDNFRFPSKIRKGGELLGRKLGDKDGKLDYVRSKGKRHSNCKELSPFDQGPKSKISVLYFKDPAEGEIFNKVLLHGENYLREIIRLRETRERERRFNSNEDSHKESVDLRSLLMCCSQAIAVNDHKVASELIKQIKKHSSPDGNGDQRMANIFALGLEARLAGTVDPFFNQIVARRANPIDMLNAFYIVQLSSPFVTATNYFAHLTILNAVQEVSKLHLIHFGIDFGYQWPGLMQALSERKGMRPPKLRITGIDVPELGFRSIEQMEEVGRRLAAYARTFSIPFEYRAIGTKLDEICIEDVNIEKDELVIVICLYRLENLGEERDVMNSSKNKVLNAIRRINPHVFIQGIINASVDGALFAPRFKQVMQHYSALFDFFDTNVPRDNKLRKFVESCLWASEAINVIACEGPKRVERPETYKQWHVRNLRAGFEHMLLDRTVVNKIKRTRDSHNRGFFVEDDNEWLLLGWKGRTIFAISTWRPKHVPQLGG